jgi:O-methyltransferase involved in polyketide biosynthesis
VTEQREPEGLAGVAATSLVVAAARAAEHRRPDRLFGDPYAELFLRAAGDASAHGRAQPYRSRRPDDASTFSTVISMTTR